MKSVKIKRIESNLCKCLSDILVNEASDSLLKTITITGADVSSDLSYAKVYFTSLSALSKNELEKELAAKTDVARQRGVKLESLQLTIPVLVGDEGKLYGSIGSTEIVDAIIALGGETSKQEVQLPNGPIRAIGEYTVEMHLHHGDVIANVKVSIIHQ